MRAFSLALRFLLELTLLAGLAIAGARLADGVAGLLLAVGLPVLAARDLGHLDRAEGAAAPARPRAARGRGRAVRAGGGALIAAGLAAAGIALGVVYGISLGLLLGLGQRGDARLDTRCV